MTEVSWLPRNDWCLVRIIQLEEKDGIALPQVSIEGKEFHVVAVGPLVDGLEPGDKVLMVGKQGSEFYPLPGTRDLIVIKEEHVVLVEKK